MEGYCGANGVKIFMHNPWEEIDLKVYENHMSLQSVYQLQALNELMKGQFHTYDVKYRNDSWHSRWKWFGAYRQRKV